MSPGAIADLAGRARRRTGAQPEAEGLVGAGGGGLWLRRAVYGAVILALVFGADALYRWALASPYFRVQRVEVTGTAHLSRSVVRARLGLARGDNLLALDLEALRRRLENHPWVRSASLSRDLPGALRVEVVERRPWAVVALPDDRGRYLIDPEGVVLAEAGAGSERFPVLRGWGAPGDPGPFQAGRVLSGKALGAGLAAVRAFGTVRPGLRGKEVRLAAVDVGGFSGDGSLRMDILGPKGQAALLRLSHQDLENGLRRFAVFLRLWQGDAWPAEVDLSMGDRVIVR